MVRVADTYHRMKRFLSSYGGFAGVAVAVAALIFALNLPFVPAGDWVGHDSEWYIKMAEGRAGEVIQPFAGRFLFPTVAHWLDTYLFHDVTFAFLSLSIVSLLAFFLINAAILKKTLKHPLLLVPLFFLPYFFLALREFFLPDVFYVFLISLFFLSLYLEREGASLVVLFALFLARETTALLGLVLVVVSWLRSRKLLSVAVLVVVIISLYTSGVVSSVGAPNIHGLSTPVYLIFKFSYNFLANVFGVRLWVTGYHFCEPVSRIALPALPLLGNIREMGLCGFDASFPVSTAVTLLSVFGVMPLLLFFIIFKRSIKTFLQTLKDYPFWFLVALAYGIAQYFIGVPSGTGVQRIVGYGWPAFLLATPFLMGKFFELDKKFIVKLSLIQLFVAWLPFFAIQKIGGYKLGYMIFSLLLILAAYLYTYRLLKKQKTITPQSIASV